MVSLTVPEKYNNRKLDRFLLEHFTQLSYNALYKALRTKDIRVNGIRINKNVVLKTGDRIDIYIKDEILSGASAVRQNSPDSIPIEIVYEDKNLLLVNKMPGIPVHPDKDPSETTLVGLASRYLIEKGEYSPENPDSFAPALCHRLDRNTGGIVIMAKNAEALDVMLDTIKKRQVKKFYQCLVIGCPEPAQAELRHYLFKDAGKSLVYISDKRKPGAVEIITRYKVLEAGEEICRLEVELVTGKTHQIRAHLAYIGHPIVGDGKYGLNRFNRKFRASHQALWAYKVVFDFESGGVMDYLGGKVFKTENIQFDVCTKGK